MRYLAAALALVLGAAACTEEKAEVTGITLDKDQLQLKVEETYQLLATVEPASMSNAALAWESSDTEVAVVDQEGKVTAVAEGTAEIKVSCGAAEDVCTVTVTGDFAMTLSVLEMSSSSVKVEAVPTDETVTYYMTLMAKADYEALGNDESIISEVTDGLRQAAGQSGSDLKDYLSSVLKTGIAQGEFTDLRPDTEYMAFAFALDTEMNAGNTVFFCEARTDEAVVLDFTLEVSNVKYDGFDISITPSSDESKYFHAYLTERSYQNIGGTDEALLDYYKTAFAGNAALASMSIEDYMQQILVSGKQQAQVIKLLPDSTYYYVAMQFDITGEHFGKLAKEKVTTVTQDLIDFTAEVTFDDVAQNSVEMSTKVSDQEPRYCIEVLTKTAIARFGETIEEGAIGWWYFRTETARDVDSPEHPLDQFITEITLAGDQTGITRTELESAQDYVAFVFAVDKYGIPISAVSYKEFRTEGRQFNLEMSFEVEYSYSDADDVMSASVTPSDNKQVYFFDIILADNVKSIIDQPELVVNWAMRYPFFSMRLYSGKHDHATVMRSKAYAIAFAYDSETGDVSEPYIKELDPEDYK